MHVLRFGNKLNKEVCHGFIFANLFNSLYLFARLWWNILVTNLVTNFQDLVTKVKNLAALAPLLGAISHPVVSYSLLIRNLIALMVIQLVLCLKFFESFCWMSFRSSLYCQSCPPRLYSGECTIARTEDIPSRPGMVI